MHTNSKIIIAGNNIHVYQFSKEHIYGISKKTYKNRRARRDEDPAPENISNIYRAKKAVKLILEANAFQFSKINGFQLFPLFATLTFKDNVQDVKQANKYFKLFIKRLNYTLNFKAKYLVVPEFQKRGAVHYHVIFFNFPKLEDTNKYLTMIWGHGFTFNNSIKTMSHLTNYVTKYFVKSMSDERLRGKKHYFCSRKLDRPQVLINRENNANIIELLNQPKYQNFYQSRNEFTVYSVHENEPLVTFLKREYQDVDNLFDTNTAIRYIQGELNI